MNRTGGMRVVYISRLGEANDLKWPIVSDQNRGVQGGARSRVPSKVAVPEGHFH